MIEIEFNPARSQEYELTFILLASGTAQNELSGRNWCPRKPPWPATWWALPLLPIPDDLGLPVEDTCCWPWCCWTEAWELFTDAEDIILLRVPPLNIALTSSHACETSSDGSPLRRMWRRQLLKLAASGWTYYTRTMEFLILVSGIHMVRTIDYRCDNGRFPVSVSWLSSPKPTLLSSSEPQVKLGIGSQEKRLSESAQCQQAIGGIYFTETWRPEALLGGLEIGKSQPRSKVCNFECMSWLNGSFFGGKHQGVLKEGDLSNGTHHVAS